MSENPAGILLSFQASYFTLVHNWYFFLHLLVLQFAFASLISSVLSGMISEKNSLSILSHLGGVLGIVLFSLGTIVLKIKPSPSLGMAVVIAALIILILRRKHLASLLPSSGMVFFFLFILLLRLIFVQGLLVPPYADSVTHLQIVLDLMNPDRPPQAYYWLTLDLEHSYHAGFHALAAWLSNTTNIEPAQAILLLGQYFQALVVLAIYPIGYLLFKNSLAAWGVMCISGLLLPVPAYASNWGKYPAIASMIGISFVLSMVLIRFANKKNSSSKFWVIGALALLATTALHSRSLFAVMVFLAFFGLFFSYKANLLEKKFLEHQGMMATVLNILLFFFIMIFFEYEIPFLLFLGLLIISVFAFYADFILASNFIVIALTMGILHYFPLDWLGLPERFNTIFDRPYLIILSYIPASILIWNGLEGIIRLLFENNHKFPRRQFFTSILILGLTNSIFIQNHHPSDCCIFLNDDDLFAFQWMQQNLPDDTLVGISAIGKPGNFLPADGGAWIESFTNVPTRKLDSGTDFMDTAADLCAESIEYYYLDNLKDSFDEYSLVETGGIYQFGLGGVKIYKLDCMNLPVEN